MHDLPCLQGSPILVVYLLKKQDLLFFYRRTRLPHEGGVFVCKGGRGCECDEE